MSRVVVIGATGHVGTYLVPRLVRSGHEVIALSRGQRGPYHYSPEWRGVRQVTADRDAEDAAGTFGGRIAGLRPDVVIDMVCFTAGSARQLWNASAARWRLAIAKLFASVDAVRAVVVVMAVPDGLARPDTRHVEPRDGRSRHQIGYDSTAHIMGRRHHWNRSRG